MHVNQNNRLKLITDMRQQRKIVIRYHQTTRIRRFHFSTFLSTFIRRKQVQSLACDSLDFLKIIALIIDNPKNIVVVRSHFGLHTFLLVNI